MKTDPVNSKLIQWLSEAWCWLTTRHYYLAVHTDTGWYLQCYHCGRQTAGWTLDQPPTPKGFTNNDIQELRDIMVDVELSLHGGG